MIEVTQEEAEDMDNILAMIVKINQSHFYKSIQVNYLIKTYLDKTRELYYIDIIYRILDYKPEILFTEEKNGLKTVIFPSSLLDNFLSDGGFSRIAVQQIKDGAHKKELEKLNLEKARLDIRNSKRIYRTYWWTFSFSVISLIVSIILLYLKISEDR